MNEDKYSKAVDVLTASIAGVSEDKVIEAAVRQLAEEAFNARVTQARKELLKRKGILDRVLGKWRE